MTPQPRLHASHYQQHPLSIGKAVKKATALNWLGRDSIGAWCQFSVDLDGRETSTRWATRIVARARCDAMRVYDALVMVGVDQRTAEAQERVYLAQAVTTDPAPKEWRRFFRDFLAARAATSALTGAFPRIHQ